MVQFTVNANRFDPYKNFKFRVKWDGRTVAGVSGVSALKRNTEAVEHREGGGANHPRLSPGLTRFEPITLERGVTHDTDFEDWANLVFKTQGDPSISLANFRKDIRIELFNEAGQLVIAYVVFRCWVSEYQAISELGAASPASTAFERITLQHEGWERDLDVVEPSET